MKTKKKNSGLFDIWKKSYEELDKESKKLFSNHMRLYINRLLLNYITHYSDYESRRFEERAQIDQVIVGMDCPRCSNFDYMLVHLIYYLNWFFGQPENTTFIQNIFKCNNCLADLTL